MPSLHSWFQVAGSPLSSMIPPPPPPRTLALLYTQTVRFQVYNPADNMSCCVMRVGVLEIGGLSSHYYYFVFSNLPYFNKDLIGSKQ